MRSAAFSPPLLRHAVPIAQARHGSRVPGLDFQGRFQVAGHGEEPVDHPVEPAQLDRHARGTQPVGVGNAFVVQRIETGDGDDNDPIPAEFRAIWNTFRIALATQDAAHAE